MVAVSWFEWLEVFEKPDSIAMCRTIRKYPFDDTPKHIWLDWLAEWGPDPDYAEFLRTKVGDPLGGSGASRPVIENPQNPAEIAWGCRGRFRMRWLDGGDNRSRMYRSGAIGCLVIEGNCPTDLAESAVEAVSFSPYDVSIDRTEDNFLRVAGVPAIEASYAPTREFAAAWTASPRFVETVRLDLSGTGTDSSEVAAIVGSPHAAGLVELHLPWNPIGVDGAIALANSPHLGKLSLLFLMQCGIRADGVAALSRAVNLSTLRGLFIGDNGIGDAGARALANSPQFRNLAELSLQSNNIGDAGAIALANSPHFAKLHALDLSANDIGDAGAIALASSPYLSSLNDLNLFGNRIGKAGRVALMNSPYVVEAARERHRELAWA